MSNLALLKNNHPMRCGGLLLQPWHVLLSEASDMVVVGGLAAAANWVGWQLLPTHVSAYACSNLFCSNLRAKNMVSTWKS